MNILEIAEKNREAFGEYSRVLFKGETWTSVRMDSTSARLASALADWGVRPGDRVATLMTNRPEILIAYSAIFRVGGAIVPMMHLLQAEEIALRIADSQPSAIVTEALFAPKIIEALQIARLERTPALIVPEPQPSEPFRSMHRLADRWEPMKEIAPREADDLAVLLYTSGTTGRPKGVVQTHANLTSNAEAAGKRAEEDGIEPEKEVGMTVLPLAHAYGMMLLTLGYQFKTQTVLLPAFSPTSVLEAIQAHRVTATAFVPTMIRMLLAQPDLERYDLSSLKRVRCGSAPLEEATIHAFQEKFGCTLYEGYGLTESGGILSAHRDSRPIKVGSVGIPLEHVEIRIFDEKDQPVPTGELGEVVARGPNVMKGYYGMPEETAETLRGGWLHTGDIGSLDDDGYLYIADRKKDLIIRGGFNILPTDVEDVLSQHAAVAECSVIGVPDPILGEEIKACVVLATGSEASKEELMEFCRARMSHNKAPKYVRFMGYLPKNPIGKILKKELRKIAGTPDDL